MLQESLAEAIALACEVHRDQVDAAGAPYILHALMQRAGERELKDHHGEQPPEGYVVPCQSCSDMNMVMHKGVFRWQM